jgi:DNA primase
MTIFDFVKSHLSIYDVVAEYVQIKRAGTYLKGSCPFHSETDASFTISPDKNIFYCFGCHAGGDVISFIAKIENLSQKEAVEFLIEKHKLTIPEEIKMHAGKNLKVELDKKEKFFNTCATVAQWAHKKLLTNAHVLNYIKSRGMSNKSIKSFNIGYLPGGIRNVNIFIKEMAQNNILFQDLCEANILAQGKTAAYSPYEERIIFPIQDAMGRYCGFGGRIFNENDQRAKYYNSRESPLFLKGKILFGLDKAKRIMTKKECAFLVEGYTDCIAMHEHDYKNAVATLGTACTAEHLKMLSRYVSKLYVLYDGDAAGQKAILRLTELCWNINLELAIIKLPPKEDPASFLDKGNDLQKMVEHASDIFSFFIESTGANFWQKSLSDKIKSNVKIIEIIARIPNRLKQDLLLQRAAAITRIPFESLKQALYKQDSSNQQDSTYQNTNTAAVPIQKSEETPFDEIPLIEAKIFAAIINKPSLQINNDLLPYFSTQVQNLIQKLLQFVPQNDKSLFNFHDFLEKLGPEERDWVVKKSILFDNKVSQDLLNQLFSHFQRQNWKQIVQNIKLNILKAREKNDSEKLQELLVAFTKMKQGMKSKGLI